MGRGLRPKTRNTWELDKGFPEVVGCFSLGLADEEMTLEGLASKSLYGVYDPGESLGGIRPKSLGKIKVRAFDKPNKNL
jgi:hypothetical protein